MGQFAVGPALDRAWVPHTRVNARARTAKRQATPWDITKQLRGHARRTGAEQVFSGQPMGSALERYATRTGTPQEKEQ